MRILLLLISIFFSAICLANHHPRIRIDVNPGGYYYQPYPENPYAYYYYDPGYNYYGPPRYNYYYSNPGLYYYDSRRGYAFGIQF